MKIIAMFFCLLMLGCTTGKDYASYLEAYKAFYSAWTPSTVTLDLQLDEQGKVKSIKTAQPNPLPPFPKQRELPELATVNKFLSVGAMVGGIYFTGEAIKGITESVGKHAGGNTYDSYNDSSVNTADSFNSSIDRHDSGDFREFDDYNQTNIADSYNPTDNHAIDNHPIDDHSSIVP